MPYSVEGSKSSSGSSYVDDDEGSVGVSDDQPGEIRNQVVALVERVVPEELDNVDEMIAQFKGREHELLETLRTMQERDIALKAKRAADNKTKLELSDKDEKMKRKLATIEAANVRSQQQQEEEDTSTFEDDDSD